MRATRLYGFAGRAEAVCAGRLTVRLVRMGTDPRTEGTDLTTVPGKTWGVLPGGHPYKCKTAMVLRLGP